MQIVAGLCKQRRHVARRASCFAVKDRLPPSGRVFEVAPVWRRGCWDRQLIEVKGREFRRYSIRRVTSIVRAALRRDRILLLVGESRIEERPRALHFSRPNVRVPIWDGPEPCPRVEVHARQTERWWNQRAGLFPIGSERFPVSIEYCVEPSRPPTSEYLPDRG